MYLNKPGLYSVDAINSISITNAQKLGFVIVVYGVVNIKDLCKLSFHAENWPFHSKNCKIVLSIFT